MGQLGSSETSAAAWTRATMESTGPTQPREIQQTARKQQPRARVVSTRKTRAQTMVPDSWKHQQPYSGLEPAQRKLQSRTGRLEPESRKQQRAKSCPYLWKAGATTSARRSAETDATAVWWSESGRTSQPDSGSQKKAVSWSCKCRSTPRRFECGGEKSTGQRQCGVPETATLRWNVVHGKERSWTSLGRSMGGRLSS